MKKVKKKKNVMQNEEKKRMNMKFKKIKYNIIFMIYKSKTRVINEIQMYILKLTIIILN